MANATLAAGPAVAPGDTFISQVADPVVLREAWRRVQQHGRTSGVDGVTIEAFRAGVDRRLTDIERTLRTGLYQPMPIKRVNIPKAPGQFRPLGIPTVSDRVVQTAATIVMNDRVNGVFSNRSFAYRPFLGPHRAAIQLRQSIGSAAYALTADIEKFFDNVDHAILASQLRRIGIDGPDLDLIRRWLTAPVHDGSRRYQPVKGLPQGAPISPVLANLHLNDFDTALEVEGFVHVRYADDFVVLTDGEDAARRALQYVAAYLGRLRLRLKAAKTQYVAVAEGFRFVGFWFTSNTWTLPEDSIVRFRDTIVALLAPDARQELRVVAKAQNDLVRGWRNYYSGHSAEMDRQLTDLDAWRAEQLRAWLTERGHDAATAAAWLESLAASPEPVAPPGTYAVPPGSDEPQAHVVEPNEAWYPGHLVAGPPIREHAFTRMKDLRSVHIGSQQLPIVSEDGVVSIPTFGAFVTRSHSLLVVRRKKQTIFECPFDDISSVSIDADGVAVSTTAIGECARRRIAITVCRLSGRAVARVLPAASQLDPPLLDRQVRARHGRRGTRLVASLLAAKLANQRALLLYHAKYRRRHADTRLGLRSAAAGVAQAAGHFRAIGDRPLRLARTELFLIEARAAGHYWRAFKSLIPDNLGFTGRVGRGATDVVNKALNYGYALLLNQVWLAAYRAGLEPGVGILHSGRRRAPGLVFDLMEPFRQPVVDRAVLALVGRGVRLALRPNGDLTLRSRSLLRRAVANRLGGGTTNPRGLALTIRRDARAFRRALLGGPVGRSYRMSW